MRKKKLVLVLVLLMLSCNLHAQSTWQSTFAPGKRYTFYDVLFKNMQTGIAIADTGIVYQTTNSGANWNIIFFNQNYFLKSLYFVSNDTILAIGDDFRIYRSSNFGYNWAASQMPNFDANKITMPSKSIGFASCNDYAILKTTNGGITWDSNTAMIYPQLPQYIHYYKVVDIKFINENTGWALGNEKIQGIGGNFTSVSKLIKTTNSGGNWITMKDTSIYNNINSFYSRMDFSGENKGLLFNDLRKIISTSNGGTTWSDFSTFNFIMYKVKMMNEGTGWITGEGLWKTTNGGLNWFLQFYHAGQFVYSLCYINSDSAWFSGQGNSIYRTTDGGGIISSINTLSGNFPNNFSLHQNYPNPFNPSTKINYEIKNSGFVTLKVFDLLGKEVATLVNEQQNAGSYAVNFNSAEYNLPSGIYFYTLSAGEFKETKKMILIK